MAAAGTLCSQVLTYVGRGTIWRGFNIRDTVTLSFKLRRLSDRSSYLNTFVLPTYTHRLTPICTSGSAPWEYSQKAISELGYQI